jgi:hypothetical protein
MPNNDPFKTVLHDAKLICRSKFNDVKAKFGENNAEVVGIQNKLKAVYGQFDNPDVWSQVLAYDHSKIMSLVLKVGIADPSDLPNFIKVTTDLLTLLTEDVLKGPLEKVKKMQASDWNQKTLDALRLAHQRVAGREKYFKNRNGLGPDSGFKKLDDSHNLEAAKYRVLLNTPPYKSTQSDNVLIKNYGEMIKKSVDEFLFIEYYRDFTDLIITLNSETQA